MMESTSKVASIFVTANQIAVNEQGEGIEA